MSKINIFGSCVSRDAFAFSPIKGLSVAQYFARSSFASAFHSEQFPRRHQSLLENISSPFQRRMVEWDLTKATPCLLRKSTDKWVLIDLIDERFSLVRVEGAIATWSAEFSQLGIPSGDFDEIIRPGSDVHWSLWEAGAREFVQVVGVERIILNRAMWARQRLDGSEMPNLDTIDASNRLLLRMYDFLKMLGVDKEIVYSDELVRADVDHKWGLSPFHFGADFYRHTMDQLANITGDRAEISGGLQGVLSRGGDDRDYLLRPFAGAIRYPAGEFAPLDVTTLGVSKGSITLPLFSNMVIPVQSLDDIGWRHEFKTQHRSSTMWLLSLYPAGRLLEAYRQKGRRADFDAAQSIIISFIEFLENENAWEYVGSIASADHATANRTSVLARYIEACRGLSPRPSQADRIVHWLRPHMAWLDDDSKHPPNNHGLMMDRSMLIGAAIYGTDRPDGAAWAEKAIGRVLAICAQMFDSDGYACENTPGYHNFNISVISGICEVATENAISTPGVTQLLAIVDRAREVLRQLIWQDGSIPSMGDSPVYDSRLKSVNKSKWYRDSHLLVVKNEELYFSLVCGRRSDSHKQVDDSSITLRYRGEDILIDGGSYNYDPQDPIRRCLESTRGHSGVYPDAMDKVLPPYRARGFPVQARLLDFSEYSDHVEATCEYELAMPDGIRSSVTRAITIVWPGELKVVDRVTSSDSLSARQTFLFGASMRWEQDGSGYVLTTQGGLPFTLNHLSASDHDWFCGESGAETRGWYSKAPNQVEPVPGVDFRQTGQSLEFRTVIKLGCERMS